MRIHARQESDLRCLARVAEHGRRLVSSRQIAVDEGPSREYVKDLLQQLRSAGFLETTRGPQGGYRLARPASDIPVWSVIEWLGRPQSGGGLDDRYPTDRAPSAHDLDRTIQAFWEMSPQVVRILLDGVTVADLLPDERGRSALIWVDEIAEGL